MNNKYFVSDKHFAEIKTHFEQNSSLDIIDYYEDNLTIITLAKDEKGCIYTEGEKKLYVTPLSFLKDNENQSFSKGIDLSNNFLDEHRAHNIKVIKEQNRIRKIVCNTCGKQLMYL